VLAHTPPNIESSGRGTIEKKRSLPEGVTKRHGGDRKSSGQNDHLNQEGGKTAETLAKEHSRY